MLQAFLFALLVQSFQVSSFTPEDIAQMCIADKVLEKREAHYGIDESRAQAVWMAEADNQNQGFDELWLGDSILNFLSKDLEHTVAWNGTSVFVAAVPGNYVYSLLWRLEHGGHVMHKAHPKIIVVLIGANDLKCTPFEPYHVSGAESLRKAADDIVKRILLVLHYLLKQYPAAHIVNVGLIPQQNASDVSGQWPNFFTAAMELINVQLRIFASSEDRVLFVDCSHVFLEPDESQILPLFDDSWHPNPEGNMELLQCFARHTAQLRNAITGHA